MLAGLGTSAVESVSETDVYGKVLRLHVVANSDSDSDQRLKLKVRDEILCVTEKLFFDCVNVDDAVKRAKENVAIVESVAKRVLAENGYFGDVKIVIGKERYPEKRYGAFVFPKGEYLSFRVLIGEGQGENWWCVLFPPLCNSGIEDGGEILESRGMSKEEIEVLRKRGDRFSFELFGCKIKFRIMDYLT